MLSSVTVVRLSQYNRRASKGFDFRRTVNLGRGVGDEMVVQSRQHFLDVSHTDRSRRWRLEAVRAGKVEVDRVLKVLPLLPFKKITPLAVSESDGLVWAELLGAVHGARVPCEAAGHGVQALHRVLGVVADPLGAHILSGAGAVVVVVL